MADVQARLDNIEEEVTCPVCTEIFTDPRNLPCLHSFCLQCLKQWYKKNQGTENPRYDAITCPTCRGISNVPESGDLNDLPISFYLHGLIDVLAVKESSNTQVTCGNCGEKSLDSSYCFECSIFYCKECVNAHNRMRDTKNHRTLALKDFQEKDFDDLLKRPAFCPKQRHQKEELKYYCKNCRAAVCQVCSTLEHSGHTLELIEDEASRQKEQIPVLVDKQKQNLQAEKVSLNKVLKDSAKVVQQREDLKANIQRHARDMIAVIDRKKKCLIDEAENQAKETLKRLKHEKVKIESRMKLIEETLEKSDQLLTRGSFAEIIQLKKSLELITEETEKVKPFEPNPEKGLPMLVLVKNEHLQELINEEEVGHLVPLAQQTKAQQCIVEGSGQNDLLPGCEVHFTLKTRNGERLQCYNEHDQVAVMIQTEGGHSCDTVVQVNNNKNGQYDLSFCLKCQGRYSVLITVNGEEVQGSPFPLQVSPAPSLLVKGRSQTQSAVDIPSHNETGRFSSRSPSIHSLPAQLHAQSLENGASAQVVSGQPFQAKPSLSFGKKGSRDGQFRHPWGVAVSRIQEIAVTDSENHRVQIFDFSGNHLRSFGRQGSNQGEFCIPLGICFDKRDNIFVADSGNHRVQIFSAEGRYLGMFGWKGSRDNHLSNPTGLSLDSNGNIIVVDSGNKLVKIFSTGGKLLRKIGGAGVFSSPIHCIECNDCLFVSCHEEHCIKVFSIWGDFKYQFGKQGTGDGEFKVPYCLAVSHSKELMVCDWQNNRIQLFELDGTFAGKFGAKGKRLGEFDHPMSVAVLRSSRVVVCDSRNHQIQIFE